MQRELRLVRKLMTGVAAVVFAVCAQDTKPSCNHCSATYISNDELQAYLKRAPARIVANDVSDQQVRALDIGKTNVDIGIVYRRPLSGESPAKRRPATNENVRMLNGPGSNGTSIRNGMTYQLKPGDVIVIPAGVGHWFTKIDDHIRYLMVRIDPDKVTPLKDEAASKADLSRDRN